MIETRGNVDEQMTNIISALKKFETKHPNSTITVYRQNSVSVRIRIVDESFDGIAKADRHDTVWKLIEGLDSELQNEISLLLLLTPDELKNSFANFEFDNPIPTKL